tara:strand:+ start:2828 stop:6310 length:3483 start_codon:yes stop_codon:yes gene_type:complete
MANCVCPDGSNAPTVGLNTATCTYANPITQGCQAPLRYTFSSENQGGYDLVTSDDDSIPSNMYALKTDDLCSYVNNGAASHWVSLAPGSNHEYGNFLFEGSGALPPDHEQASASAAPIGESGWDFTPTGAYGEDSFPPDNGSFFYLKRVRSQSQVLVGGKQTDAVVNSCNSSNCYVMCGDYLQLAFNPFFGKDVRFNGVLLGSSSNPRRGAMAGAGRRAATLIGIMKTGCGYSHAWSESHPPTYMDLGGREPGMVCPHSSTLNARRDTTAGVDYVKSTGDGNDPLMSGFPKRSNVYSKPVQGHGLPNCKAVTKWYKTGQNCGYKNAKCAAWGWTMPLTYEVGLIRHDLPTKLHLQNSPINVFHQSASAITDLYLDTTYYELGLFDPNASRRIWEILVTTPTGTNGINKNNMDGSSGDDQTISTAGNYFPNLKNSSGDVVENNSTNGVYGWEDQLSFCPKQISYTGSSKVYNSARLGQKRKLVNVTSTSNQQTAHDARNEQYCQWRYFNRFSKSSVNHSSGQSTVGPFSQMCLVNSSDISLVYDEGWGHLNMAQGSGEHGEHTLCQAAVFQIIKGYPPEDPRNVNAAISCRFSASMRCIVSVSAQEEGGREPQLQGHYEMPPKSFSRSVTLFSLFATLVTGIVTLLLVGKKQWRKALTVATVAGFVATMGANILNLDDSLQKGEEYRLPTATKPSDLFIRMGDAFYLKLVTDPSAYAPSSSSYAGGSNALGYSLEPGMPEASRFFYFGKNVRSEDTHQWTAPYPLWWSNDEQTQWEDTTGILGVFPQSKGGHTNISMPQYIGLGMFRHPKDYTNYCSTDILNSSALYRTNDWPATIYEGATCHNYDHATSCEDQFCSDDCETKLLGGKHFKKYEAPINNHYPVPLSFIATAADGIEPDKPVANAFQKAQYNHDVHGPEYMGRTFSLSNLFFDDGNCSQTSVADTTSNTLTNNSFVPWHYAARASNKKSCLISTVFDGLDPRFGAQAYNCNNISKMGRAHIHMPITESIRDYNTRSIVWDLDYSTPTLPSELQKQHQKRSTGWLNAVVSSTCPPPPATRAFSFYNLEGKVDFAPASRQCSTSNDCPELFACRNGICVSKAEYVTADAGGGLSPDQDQKAGPSKTKRNLVIGGIVFALLYFGVFFRRKKQVDPTVKFIMSSKQ